MEDDSIDAIVTDPPYGFKFMGHDWDRGVPGKVFWDQMLRISKPGAHLLAFGGTRTFHRLACAIEDGGWMIRDCLMWVYGSGFPKSHNISKAIDKQFGVEREVVGEKKGCSNSDSGKCGWNSNKDVKDRTIYNDTIPATEQSKQYDGYGTALKPSFEPLLLAMKSLDGTFVDNVLKYGTGCLNIDGCRIETEEELKINRLESWSGFGQNKQPDYQTEKNERGRWPANLIHDGSDEVVDQFPNTGKPQIRKGGPGSGGLYGGSTARFFYAAKANKKERGENNNHPTVKPISLMRYLVRLLKLPHDMVVLDPFMGSGSTGIAALDERVGFIGIELDPEYFRIAEDRIKKG